MEDYLSSFFLYVGFGAKAGVFLLHDWLPFSYGAAPTPATGLLSGMLSKAGIYGIIIITLEILPGDYYFSICLIVVSILNMLVGGFFAFCSKDLKKTLAFSSFSQIGFILWGIGFYNLLGEHNTYAAYATAFHLINHSLIKILLFSLVGVIDQNTMSLELNEIRGCGRDKPWLKITFGFGALSLMGIPLFSGYVSKTLLHESVVEWIHYAERSTAGFVLLEYGFLLAGGFTFAYMLKLFFCLFIEEGDLKLPPDYVTKKTKISLTIVSISLLLLGVTPNLFFSKIGEFLSQYFRTQPAEIIPYFSWINLQGSLITIGIGLILYFGIGRKTVIDREGVYRDYNTGKFSLDCLIYQPILINLSFFFGLLARILDVLADLFIIGINRFFYKSVEIPKTFTEGEAVEDGHKKSEIHFTYSLAYSLLLFGIGFLFTLIYLIVQGVS